MSDDTKQRWLNLWGRVGARGSALPVYDDLNARYAESHRAYHTLDHIQHCLSEFDRARHLTRIPNAIEWALWYHDVIYDTKAGDNEENSAALAAEVAGGASLHRLFAQGVTNLILTTKHDAVPVDPNAQLLVDIDLSILGQPEDRFNEYERQIRREYEWVPEASFVSGRSMILEAFLARPMIYSTQFFRDKYEVRARQNIERSLAQLHV